MKYYKEIDKSKVYIWSYDPVTKMNRLYTEGAWLPESNDPSDRINEHFTGESDHYSDSVWIEITKKEAFLEIL